MYALDMNSSIWERISSHLNIISPTAAPTAVEIQARHIRERHIREAESREYKDNSENNENCEDKAELHKDHIIENKDHIQDVVYDPCLVCDDRSAWKGVYEQPKLLHASIEHFIAVLSIQCLYEQLQSVVIDMRHLLPLSSQSYSPHHSPYSSHPSTTTPHYNSHYNSHVNRSYSDSPGDPTVRSLQAVENVLAPVYATSKRMDKILSSILHPILPYGYVEMEMEGVRETRLAVRSE